LAVGATQPIKISKKLFQNFVKAVVECGRSHPDDASYHYSDEEMEG